jgi:hypothetical protein
MSVRPPANLLRLRVKIENPVIKCCGYPVSVIDRGQDANLALRCANCGKQVGRMSLRTADIISKAVDAFGLPDEPITLRRKSTR